LNLSANNDRNLPIKETKSNIKLVSGLELTGIFFAVLLIIYVLFPNERVYMYLKRQIEEFSEDEDVYLSIKYLEKILKEHPRQKDLRLALIRKYLEVGNYEKAKEHLLEYIKLYGENENTILLEYTILSKEVFQHPEDSPQRKVGIEKLKKYIQKHIDKVNDPDILEFFFKQALSLDMPKTALKIAEKLYYQTFYTEKKKEWLKNAFKLAIETGNLREAKQLYKEIPKNLPEKLLDYTLKLAELETAEKDYKDAIQHYSLALRLEDDKRKKQALLRKLAQISLWRTPPQYRDAVRYYMTAISLSDSYQEKKENFLLALKTALAGELLDEAVKIAETYGTFFEKDKEVLKEILKVYLAKGDVNKAYALVEKGLGLYPDDLDLKKEAGDIALWNSNPETAFQYYLEYYSKTKNPAVRDKLLWLALALKKYFVAKELLEEEIKSGNYDKALELADIYANLGEPEKAIALLRELYKRNKNPELLKKIVKIELSINDVENAKKDLEELLKIGDIDVKDATELAYLFYINKQYDKALSILKFVKNKATDKDLDYWTTLGDLAWDLGDKETAIETAQYLYKIGKARNVDLERLIYYYAEKHDYKNLEKFAKILWEKAKTPNYLYYYLTALYEQGKYKEVLKTISKLDSKTLNTLKDKPYFWGIYANSLVKLGNIDEAVKVYEMALKYNPDNKDIISSFLWFLIDTKQTAKLEKYLRKYKYLAYEDKNFAFLYGVAYTILQNSLEAKAYLKRLIDEDPTNVDYLLLYADAVDLSGETEIAQKYRFKIWKELNEKLKKNPELIKNREFLKDYLRLAIIFAPATEIEKVMKTAEKVLTKKEINSIKITWYLARGEYDKAKQLIKKKLGVEPWMELSVALNDYDKDEMSRLLKKKLKALPIRDRVTAARVTGEVGKAKDLAFKGLEKNRRDWQLYKQYKELAEDFNSKVSASVKVTDREINITEVGTEARFNTNKNYLISVGDKERINPTSGGGLKNLPANSRKSYVKITEKDDKKQLDLEVGRRTGVKDTIYAKFNYEQYVANEVSVNLQVGKNLETDESLYLLFGGKKDNLKFGFMYNPTPYDYLSASIEHNKYYSLDDKNIGTGTIFDLQLTHKFRLGYPDFTVTIYGRKGIFSENEDKGIINKISTYANPQVLPVSYNEGGIVFSFGENKRKTFNKTWRPYLSTSLSYNDVYGAGYGISGGITGSPFLNGDLSIGFQFNKGFKGTGNTITSVYLEYFLFF
jgi:tetratricopeptide (TPR) repeat protein